MNDFSVALSDVCRAWPALLPPNRMRVSEGVAKNMMIKRPGGSGGLWNPLETAYMVEPMDMLASRTHSAVCFVGPAQTGKTAALAEGWLTHNVINDPGDMLIVQMTQDKAREYSKQRIDRLIMNSPNLREMRSVMSRDDNLHDKQFRNGMWLRLAWPTVSNLSSTSYRYVMGTDYDRWPDNLDGEGDGFTLMGKRITTFLSRGMVAVESSPGRPVTDPNWQPATMHEAPPVGGILGIYNRGDRRRQYWKCPHCADWFQAEPGLGLFHLPDTDQIIEDVRKIDIDAFSRQYARVICPQGCVITPDHRELMNQRGRWLQDGLAIDHLDRISGDPRTSSIASYWLSGVAAAYIPWESLIRKQMQALLEYSLTGSELQLQTTANTDQGVPYLARHLAESQRTDAHAKPREDTMRRYVVPPETRCVLAMVDVQGGKNARFVVQVHAVGEHKEQWLVDRYAIIWSKRPGDVEGEFAPLDPASHPEDWDTLTEQVLQATYRTETEGVEIRVHAAIVDTGGEDGVTDKAYAWARRVRRAGLSQRLYLSKGVGTKGMGEKGGRASADWHVRETMVGGKKDAADVTLYLLEPNKFKDMVDTGLRRNVPGPGYYHFPEPQDPERNPDGWLPQSFFDELKAEVRNPDGSWTQIKKRNESFDLCYMALALCMILKMDRKSFWEHPPAWALPLGAGNSNVITTEARREMKGARSAAARPIQRRSSRSAYMD